MNSLFCASGAVTYLQAEGIFLTYAHAINGVRDAITVIGRYGGHLPSRAGAGARNSPHGKLREDFGTRLITIIFWDEPEIIFLPAFG